MADPDVTIGRLRRRIDRLKTQRDYFLDQVAHYQKILRDAPFIERQWERHQERVRDSRRLKELEVRVQEQSALIERLMKENNDADR